MEGVLRQEGGKVSVGGGHDRSWYRPLNPEGQADHDPTTIGSFTGAFEALNIRHAQPGRQYYYERKNANALQAARNNGWRRVRPEDPERMGSVEDDMDRGSPMDSGVGTAFDDIVMMKIPIEKHRALKPQEEAENRARLEGATQSYLGSTEAAALEDRYGA